MKLTYTDIKYKLHKDSVVEFDTSSVGGPNYNGKGERRIRQIKESFEKNIQNERLSVLQWETLSSVIANAINDLRIGLGNIISDYKNMDLMTTNRLRLERNNNRNPAATMGVMGNPDRILKQLLKQDEVLSNSYQYGIVNKVVPSKDGIIRKIILRYRNHQQIVDR